MSVKRIPLGEGKPEIIVTEDGDDVIVDYPIEAKNYTINSVRLSPDRADRFVEAIQKAHSQSAEKLIEEAVENAKKNRD